jgi:hypothetical protein
MVTLRAILVLLNQRKNRVLRIAEAALPETQFRAFRGLLLDEFGREGLEKDLERLVAEREDGNGQDRPIRAKEGGAP